MTWRPCYPALHAAALLQSQLPCPAQGCQKSASWRKLGIIALDTGLTRPPQGRRVSQAFTLNSWQAFLSICMLLADGTLSMDRKRVRNATSRQRQSLHHSTVIASAS